MPASRSSKDKPDDTTTEPEVAPGAEPQPDQVGGHWEDDETTGDRRWVPDTPKGSKS